MTSANIINLNVPDSANISANTLKNAKTKTLVEEASVNFSSVLNQNVVSTNVVSDANKNEKVRLDTSAESDSIGAYDRYQYKDNSVEQGDVPTISDKIDSAKEELASFEEKVIEEISTTLDVSMGDVENVLESLGLTAFDLLIPQNLANVVATISDVPDTMELIVDADFQKLLGTIGQMGSDLMKDLNLHMDQMDELVMQMDVLDSSIELSGEFEDALSKAQDATLSMEETLAGDPQNEEVIAVVKPEEDKQIVVEDQRETSEIVPEKLSEAVDTNKNATFEDGRSSSKEENGKSLFHENHAQPMMQQDVFQMNANEAVTEPISYASIDTLEMIERIASNVKVILESDATTMEMQLNPENLGKIYLNVSTKEGAVSAQIAAQNEAVREALEMQIATLREHLNQAGIKVDAVEVTIASHEFERNLEQNASSEQRQNENEQKAPRRNLNLDSLDELSGLMSEEEALVAKIMKDNGNSVDFSA